ncbi:TylF/MycF/NovP-related O-methyltransferase [Methylorubrum extorquens]
MALHYSVTQTPAVFVDWEALDNIVNACNQPGQSVALVGFNEYSKHILNLHPDKVAAIYDAEEWKVGITYKGVTVSPPTEKHSVTKIVCCSYAQAYEFLGKIWRLYDRAVPWYCPPRIEYKNIVEINVFEQEGVYQAISADASPTRTPLSMMAPEKLKFLSELLRASLRTPGNIIEMGVWQGGSAWHLAKVLRYFGETRMMYMLDLFELHMPDPTATMCKDQISRQLSFYPHFKLLEGLVDDPALLEQVEGPFCFAHYDLGFIPKGVEFIWDRLQPGCPLVLDNYGHLAVNPWEFDDFFSARGAHVIRLPWSEQGIVFKQRA